MTGKSLTKYLPSQLVQPFRFLRSYQRENVRPDLIAGLTVAVILLPQAIAFTLIADLPPEMGLYAAIVAAIVGGLWGSTDQIHTGPANAMSLLVASTLVAVAGPGSGQYVLAAGLLAVMVGIFQSVLGIAHLGVLVNFVSRSVIVGFTAGAGILIGIKQLRPLLGVHLSARTALDTVSSAITHIPQAHLPTLLIGIGTIILILLLRNLVPKLPGALISMVISSLVVFILKSNQIEVDVIGSLPRTLPPLSNLPFINIDTIADLSSGALAIAAIGLVQTAAISRSLVTQTGQRVDNNQEFVSQGLANIAAGLFSGYPISASFSRSAVNIESGARTPMSAILSGIFVLITMLVLGPLGAYLPLAALAGVLILTAIRLVDYKEIYRLWRGARAEAIIMIITLLGTLFLRLDFAVLTGILLSFAVYIMNTSTPRVNSVLPDEDFQHFVQASDKPQCPQLGILEIQGDLYFGAVDHVEEAILEHLDSHPTQRLLLLRMHRVNQIDFSGIHMLETVVGACRKRAGDVYMVRVREPVLSLMKSTGFYDYLGANRFLNQDMAIEHLFYKVLDPAICIYESNVRVFEECQNLARPDFTVEISTSKIPGVDVGEISPKQLWKELRAKPRPMVIDVREPREYQRARIPDAELTPLPKILSNEVALPRDQKIVLVCRSGRRSTRGAQYLIHKGYQNINILSGGMLNWEAEGYLEAVG